MRRNGWVDKALEGAGHLECIVYSAIVCPFLTTPDYVRKTAMRGPGGKLVEAGGKGVPRGEVLLAGGTDISVRSDSNGAPAVYVSDAQQMELMPFEAGSDLVATYEGLALDRTPDAHDRAFVDLILEPSELYTLGSQVGAEVAGVFGQRIPIAQGDLCPCESGKKFRGCCQQIWDRGRARADRDDAWPVTVVDTWIRRRLAKAKRSSGS